MGKWAVLYRILIFNFTLKLKVTCLGQGGTSIQASVNPGDHGIYKPINDFKISWRKKSHLNLVEKLKISS